MPELPEVEVTRRGLTPHVQGRKILRAVVRHAGLRWGVAADLPRRVAGQTVRRLARRGKYLLLECDAGALLLHLGMSGSLRVLPAAQPAGKHDHFDLLLDDGHVVRLTDPRRFGAVLWVTGDPAAHPLLAGLGPEPFSAAFDAGWLLEHSRGRSVAVKQALMDSRLVAGIGNIYASEALFRAGIDPRTPAGRIGPARYRRLAEAVREVLREAIQAGGSSLRNFVNSAGEAGHFQIRWQVYGRAGEPCPRCGRPIRSLRQGQRATFYCPRCQR